MSRLASLLLLVLATGCGQKGPLYFAPPPESRPAPEDGEVERDRPEDADRPGGVAPGEPSELP